MKRVILAALALLLVPGVALAQTNTSPPTFQDSAGTERPASASFLVGGSTFYTDSTTPLGISGTFTGTTRQVGVTGRSQARHNWFVAEAWSDVAGTLFVEKSTNGGQTWSPVNGTTGTAVAAGTTVTVAARITALHYRVRYVNGAGAQASFVLTSALTNS